MNELESKQILKTGTTTVGLVCKDGIVIAADRRATAGYVVNKKAKKVVQISDDMALTTAGSVSDIQLFIKLIQAELKLKDIQTGRKSTAKEAANLISGILYHGIRYPSMIPAIASFLLAARDIEGLHLFSLWPDGSLSKIEDYEADGSGSFFALGVFEANFKKNMTVEEGVKLAVKAVNTSLQRDPNSGNGIDVLVVTDKGLKFVIEKELIASLE